MTQAVHVTFIHGLANKPAAKDLRRIWLDALKEPVEGDPGFDLGVDGVTDSFVYWANLFYDKPLDASAYESRNDELAESVSADLELGESGWANRMLDNLNAGEAEDAPLDVGVGPEASEYERIPLPGFVKRRLMRHFVKETHDYLFNANSIRDTIQDMVIGDFTMVPDDAHHVLVGHSQGTFIAYDVLTAAAGCKEIQGFLTLGSPLGIDEIQDKLHWTRENGFPSKLTGDWVNVYDPLDVVSRLDPNLAGDFKQDGVEKVIDVSESNEGHWRHSATKYFKGPKLRNHLRRLCNRTRP